MYIEHNITYDQNPNLISTVQGKLFYIFNNKY